MWFLWCWWHHLSFVYSLIASKICMGLVSCAFGINMSLGFVSEICTWIVNFPISSRRIVPVGVTVVFWAIWKGKINVCFRNVFLYDQSSVINSAYVLVGLLVLFTEMRALRSTSWRSKTTVAVCGWGLQQEERLGAIGTQNCRLIWGPKCNFSTLFTCFCLVIWSCI